MIQPFPLLVALLASLTICVFPSPASGEGNGYAGAETCRTCHRAVYERWRGTAHGQAMGEATPAIVKGDFESHNVYAYGGNTSRMAAGDDGYRMTTDGPDGKPGAYGIGYTLGIRQQQTYLTRMPGGRLQVLPTIYDVTGGRWFDAAEGIVRVGRPLRPGDFYYWSGPGRTWNSQCAECHATGVRKGYDPASDTYDTQFSDLSIACEACHGPAASHVSVRKGGMSPEMGRMPDLGKLSPARAVEVCSVCHAKKHDMREGFRPGDDFLGHFDPVLADDEQNFWPDGQDKLLVFAYHAFTEGRPYREGGLVCTDCHDPHGSGRVADLVLAPSDPGLCSRCHGDLTDRPERHTRHAPNSAGSVCVRCHMPSRINETLLVTDHRMTVPVPENTVRFGSPNACNQGGCHEDRTPEWTAQQAARLYGAYQIPRVRRAEAVSGGWKGDPSAAGPLAKILSDSREGPFLRAAASALLGRIGAARGPDALTRTASGDEIRNPLSILIQSLRDSHPSVRARAATALGQAGALRALRPLVAALGDTSVTVRIRAAFSLTTLGRIPAPLDTADRRAFSEHEAWAHGFMADNPPARVTLGEAYESRRDFRAALAEYRAALRIDPTDSEAKARSEAVAREVLAGERVRAMLATALSANPNDVRAHTALGMAEARWGDWQEAVEHLQIAVRLGAGGEAIFVNMGDALRGLGKFRAAAEAYRQALAQAPRSPGAFRGLALIACEEGREAEGRAFEERYREAMKIQSAK